MRGLRTLVFILAALLQRPVFGQLDVTPVSIDFGERGHNENPTGTIILSNTGSSPLRIGQIKPSCSCIKVEPASLTEPIPAGGSVEVKVSMGSGRALGSLEKHIEIVPADSGVPPRTISVGMRVFPGLSISPADLKYDGVIGGKPITLSVDLTLKSRSTPPRELTITDARVRSVAVPARAAVPDSGPHFETRVSEIPGGKRIEVTLKPTHPEGRILGNLEARIDGKLVVVPVVGEMFRSIKVVPTYFNFSRVSTDDLSSFVKTSVLTSVDGKPFKILSMTPRLLRGTEAKLELTEKDVSPGGASLERTIQARVSAGQILGDGSFSGTVLVKTDHPDKPEVTLNFYGFFAEPRKPAKP